MDLFIYYINIILQIMAQENYFNVFVGGLSASLKGKNRNYITCLYFLSKQLRQFRQLYAYPNLN